VLPVFHDDPCSVWDGAFILAYQKDWCDALTNNNTRCRLNTAGHRAPSSAHFQSLKTRARGKPVVVLVSANQSRLYAAFGGSHRETRVLASQRKHKETFEVQA
jgi:uncharacterized ParB-like nuclease family protein